MSDVEAKRIGAVSEVTMAMPIRRGRVPGEFRTFRQKLEHTLASVTRREIDDIPTAIRIIDQIHYALSLIHI